MTGSPLCRDFVSFDFVLGIPEVIHPCAGGRSGSVDLAVCLIKADRQIKTMKQISKLNRFRFVYLSGTVSSRNLSFFPLDGACFDFLLRAHGTLQPTAAANESCG